MNTYKHIVLILIKFLIIIIIYHINRIELNLSTNLQNHLEYLYIATQMILDLDEYHARYKFSSYLNLSEPIISKDMQIKLYAAFHPLIENPVKNDIIIEQTKHGLIISGPNTGGKTATLKTLALTQMFLRYGLFIPCDHGEIYLYDKTFYFGNDGQNLEQGLSSFSAEVENYSSLIDHIGPSNLILIDEIFNSTTSEDTLTQNLTLPLYSR